MASYFDKLPFEVLCRIIEYLADSEKDLRQLQLTCKSCQSLAEVHIFRELKLSSSFTPTYTKSYFLFLLNPRRGKLVKTLNIGEQQPFAALNDSFFEMFPNIQILRSNASPNWDYLSKTFTANRCKLKEIPEFRRCDDGQIESCVKLIFNHLTTLEKLVFGLADPLVSCRILQSINATPWIFPKVKHIEDIELKQGAIQHLDSIINKCSLLEEIYVHFEEDEHFSGYLAVTQHQRLMKSVTVKSYCAGFLDVCKYFMAKFPNVQNWHLSTYDFDEVDEEYQPLPFDDQVMNLWNLLLSKKLTSIHLQLTTNRLSIPKALDFFTESYKLDTEIKIRFYPTTDEDEIYSNMVYIDVKQDTLGVMSIKVVYRYSKVDYLLGLIETAGRHMKKLHLDIAAHLDFSDEEMPTPELTEMLSGRVIGHVLHNCPLLASFSIHLSSFQHLDCNAIYPNLTTMNIDCGLFVKEALFFNLSHQAPNVKELTIRAVFSIGTHQNQSKKTIINMPYNSFDKLVMDDYTYEAKPKPLECIVIEIALPTKEQPRKFYFKKCNMAELDKERRVYIEQVNDTESLPRIDISIICKSIKSFMFSGTGFSLPELLF